jgi:predicted TPR repeat methyltransferase
MLDEAKILKEGTEPVYNEIINLDVDHYFVNTLNKEKFDIFIASSLLNYYSDTKVFFESCAKMAVSGALLCFTLRTHEQAVLKLFNGSIEEFTYSANLLKTLLSEQGWVLINEGEIKFLDGSSGMYIISQLK